MPGPERPPGRRAAPPEATRGHYSFGSCMVSFAACKHVRLRDACHDGRPGLGPHHGLPRTYLAMDAWAAAIFAFTASRLKLAPLCIRGNCTPLLPPFSTSRSTHTNPH